MVSSSTFTPLGVGGRASVWLVGWVGGRAGACATGKQSAKSRAGTSADAGHAASSPDVGACRCAAPPPAVVPPPARCPRRSAAAAVPRGRRPRGCARGRARPAGRGAATQRARAARPGACRAWPRRGATTAAATPSAAAAAGAAGAGAGRRRRPRGVPLAGAPVADQLRS